MLQYIWFMYINERYLTTVIFRLKVANLKIRRHHAYEKKKTYFDPSLYTTWSKIVKVTVLLNVTFGIIIN